ncbi:hypothetical protein GE061_013102 [Apolygus lucorum]|uniref:Uncharacterized protein n=1 Tax=Apolygus lucorum TaxID=248454 RepID=A0A8S9XUH0_APOLU|nr:hypothetical protein GE061_013102 [Apolygus lucorum]
MAIKQDVMVSCSSETTGGNKSWEITTCKKSNGICKGIGIGYHHCSEDCHSSTVNMKVATLVVLVLTLCALATSAKDELPPIPRGCGGCISPYHGDQDVVGMIKKHVPNFRPRKILGIYSQVVSGQAFYVVHEQFIPGTNALAGICIASFVVAPWRKPSFRSYKVHCQDFSLH